jgi:HAMP domain-containing protein
MFKNLKLSKKFNLLLLIVFIAGVLLTGSAFAVILARNAQQQVVSKALIMMETMDSVRKYTNEQVNPELADRLETEPEFIRVTVPGYSAREVFEILRQDPAYSEFFYKEATLNPTNLRDKADEFEAALVQQFRQRSDLTELSGFREIFGERLYYIARPLAIESESCLRCHSTPEAAPPSQIATYGSENGFGWQLNEIVGAQVISVPAREVFRSASQSFFLLMTIVIGAFLIAIVLVNILLSRAVIRPLNRMATVADEISTGKLDAEFEQDSADEIGMLAAAFNRMKLSLQMAMRMLNRPNTRSQQTDEGTQGT